MTSLARRLPPMSTLRAFEAAARHGSFKQAAAELAVTPTAVSHRIRTLEGHLGVRLFDRHVRQVSLTRAGLQLYPVLQQGFDMFDVVIRRLMTPAERERVTISATNAFVAKWLVPRVASFRADHPGIDLQLHASDTVVDLASHAFDIAIRYGKGPYPGCRSEVLFADAYVPVINPMLHAHSPQDMAAYPLIHFDWQKASPDNPTWTKWHAEVGIALSTTQAEFRYSDESHAIQAAVAGQGIALLSRALVADEIAAGRLIDPFGPAIPGYTYHLVTREQSSPSLAVTTVMDWLRQHAAMVISTNSCADS